MSVFKLIQGKIESVQHDLSEGIKSLRGTSKEGPCNSSRNVSYDAGSDLLNRYQEGWFAMHTEMELSAQQGQIAAGHINSANATIEKEHQLVTKLHEEMMLLPALLGEISHISYVIEKIGELGKQVEESLVHLENHLEENEMEKDRKLHLNQLEVYRLKRQGDLERSRVQLADEHTVKVRDIERSRQAQLSERHLYFETAFNQDLEFYRIFGQIERKASTETPVDLAEITIDADTTELDDFLSGVPPDQNIDTQKESSSEGEDSGIHNIHDSPTISTHRHSRDSGQTMCEESADDELKPKVVDKLKPKVDTDDSHDTRYGQSADDKLKQKLNTDDTPSEQSSEIIENKLNNRQSKLSNISDNDGIDVENEAVTADESSDVGESWADATDETYGGNDNVT